jgi:hypothetical protein
MTVSTALSLCPPIFSVTYLTIYVLYIYNRKDAHHLYVTLQQTICAAICFCELLQYKGSS